MEISFCSDGHAYALDGKPVPSVTRVLEFAGVASTEWVQQYYLDRGTALHLACHLDDAGTLDMATVDECILKPLEAWRNFKRDTGIKVLHSEKIVGSKIAGGYAGTLDKIIRWPNGQVDLLDLKHGQSAPPAVRYQLAAYACAAFSMGMPTKVRYSLALRQDSTYRLKDWSDPSDIGQFIEWLKSYWEAARLSA